MPEVRSFNEQLGIATHGNPMALPPGTAKELENLKATRDNIYEKVRGRETYGSGLPSQDIDQVFQYKDRLFVKMANDTVYYDSDGSGTFTQVTGSYTDPESGYKVKSIERQGNLYLTTGTGVRRLDGLGNSVVSAGVDKGLSFDLRLVNSTNWFSNNNTVAYRHVWTFTDANNNVVTGAPSERQEITNSDGSDRAIELRITLPSAITTSYTLQIYRSSQGTATTPPEDFQLVYEASPTSAEITAGIMEVTDILADDWRGASLYTNTTQEGIARANEKPPLANVITTYKNFTFYGNIENLHRLYTNLVSISNMTAGTSTVTFNDGTNSETYGCYILGQDLGTSISGAANNGSGLIRITTSATHGLSTGDYVLIGEVQGTTEANGSWVVTVVTTTTFDLQGSTFTNAYTSGGYVDYKSFNIGNGVAGAANNGSGLIRITTTNNHNLSTGDYVRIYDVTGTTEANSTWQVTAVAATTFDLVGSTFSNAYTSGGTVDLYEDYGATPRFILYRRGTDAQNISNTAKSLIRTVNLSTGNTYWYGYYASSAADPVGKMEFTTQSLGSAAFYLTANSAATGGTFSPVMPTSGTTYVSTNDDLQHAIMWSKEDQSEAVPLVNIKRIGSADDPIVGIVGLRDSLFIIKEKDGVHRLTGETESSFNFDEFDGTVECLAKNTIAKGDNAVYMFSDAGYCRISDVGVEVIGRNTEKDDLSPIQASGFGNAAYGWYYESEKSYRVATYTNRNSTAIDIIKEYNAFTQAWTHRLLGVYTNDTQTSKGIVVDDVEYTADLTGNGLKKERKDLADTDYYLPKITANLDQIDTSTKQLTLDTDITIHDDALVLQGGVTRLITKADTVRVFTCLSVSGLHTKLSGITVTGAADNGSGLIRITTNAAHTLSTNNGVTIASVGGTTEANGDWVVTVVDATNFDLQGSTFTNAYTSGGTVTNALTIYPGVRSRIKWQLIHGGFPEYEKLFERGTIFYDDNENLISKLYIKTSSDADKTQKQTTVDEVSEDVWEGEWDGKFGTRDITDKSLWLLPTEHARCSHLYLEVIHAMPKEKFALAGYSLIYNITDDKYSKA